MKRLGNKKNGLVFVLSAPAGTGKTTLVQKLVDEFNCVVRSISYTTRPKRTNEISGDHYYFTSKKEFEDLIKNQEFLEYVTLYGYYYGTRYKTVREQTEQGKHVILVIDTQGALLLQEKKFPGVFIFVMPPSIDVLRQRLMVRSTESPDVIEERLEWAKKELEVSNRYDYCLVNEDLNVAYEVLRSIIIAEEHRVRDGFVVGTETLDLVD